MNWERWVGAGGLATIGLWLLAVYLVCVVQSWRERRAERRSQALDEFAGLVARKVLDELDNPPEFVLGPPSLPPVQALHAVTADDARRP